MTKNFFKLLRLLLPFSAIIFSALILSQPGTAKGYIADYPSSQESPTQETTALIEQLPWHLRQIDASHAWQITSGQPDILIAVLDTGINHNHPVLAGKVVASINFSNSPTIDDRNGHGTHIAGIIAASPNTMAGIIGLAYNASILNVKVANDNGSAEAANVARGIIWAVDQGARVINVSLTIN